MSRLIHDARCDQQPCIICRDELRYQIGCLLVTALLGAIGVGLLISLVYIGQQAY